MRIGLGTALLLATTALVALNTSPVAAATGCDAPETTWVGPATPGGSASWVDPANWTAGVPTDTSVVCIPYTATGPHVLAGTAAEAGAVTLEGTLTVAGSLDVATLEGDFGELHGPGTTTVTAGLVGEWVTLAEGAVVDLTQDADLGGEVYVWDGSRLNVRGETILQPAARIDSMADNPGLFTIADGGSLTFDTPNESAQVIGGFANHGAVTVTAGHVLMIGASPDDAHPDQYSTGAFSGAPDSILDVSSTELRTGARLDHVRWVDHISVPEGNSVTVADSTLIDFGGGPEDPAGPPTITGGGELVVSDGTVLGGRIGGALTVRVPAEEVATVGDAVVQDQARVQVDGELRGADIYLNDQAVLDVYGVHRVLGGSGVVDFSGTDPGVEIIRPGGQLLTDPDGGLHVMAPFLNEGTVDSGTGFMYLGPRAQSASASSGTFRADPAGSLLLGSNVDGEPTLMMEDAVIQGAVHVSGPVTATDTEVHGEISTLPGGRLALEGGTRMTDGSSIAGDVTVAGSLDADLSPTGTASLSGAEVNGAVNAVSGTLVVPSLAPSTLSADGTLTSGHWSVATDATLELPSVTSNDTQLTLEGPGASFGEGLAALTGNGPDGILALGGGDLAVPALFRNEGTLDLPPGSRLDVGGKFRQLATGTLITGLDSTGRGRVRAAGLRDLAGRLVVDRDPAYEPLVGTMLNFITSDGAKTDDDRFDKVQSPRYGTRKLRVAYEPNRVRLWVDRVD